MNRLGFSLVETAIALGVVYQSCTAHQGKLPVGLEVARSAGEQTTASARLSEVVADVRASAGGQDFTARFAVPLRESSNTPVVLYFSQEGRVVDQNSVDACHRVELVPVPGPAHVQHLRCFRITVSWPAHAQEAEVTGQVRTFLAMDMG
jgi:uncharacterized protein (TIGR02598 family)